MQDDGSQTDEVTDGKSQISSIGAKIDQVGSQSPGVESGDEDSLVLVDKTDGSDSDALTPLAAGSLSSPETKAVSPEKAQEAGTPSIEKEKSTGHSANEDSLNGRTDQAREVEDTKSHTSKPAERGPSDLISAGEEESTENNAGIASTDVEDNANTTDEAEQTSEETPADGAGGCTNSSGETQELSKKALRRARVAWKSMGYPWDFEKLYEQPPEGGEEDAASHVSSDPPSWFTASKSSEKSEDEETPEAITDSVSNGDVWAETLIDDSDPATMDDTSISRLEWLRQKNEHKEENKALDRLMCMVGLEEVKAHFLAVKAGVRAGYHKVSGPDRLRLSLAIYGSNGTGKKTIAKLYAQLLQSIGAVDSERFGRTSMSSGDTSQMFKVEKPTVMFCDATSCVVTAARLDKIVRVPTARGIPVILSFRNDSVVKAFSHSEAAMQHLPDPISLPDYSDEELMEILRRMIKKRGFIIDYSVKDALGVLFKRAISKRKSKRFSNVHALDKELGAAIKRRALRLHKARAERMRIWVNQSPDDPTPQPRESLDDPPDNKRFIADDIIGPKPLDVRAKSKAWETLQRMIGLESFKQECSDLIDLVQMNHHREALGQDPINIGLNRLILGNPGVGKTTTAQLYGQILIELGLVSGDRVIVKDPADLLGQFIGDSETNTKEALSEAKGNVLIIDDAHMLYKSAHGMNDTDKFRIGIIDTLVAKISAENDQDRCVLLVGYKDTMNDMFENVNDGLRRRFPIETALVLEPFSLDDLCKILDQKMEAGRLKMTEPARAVARRVLDRMKINPKFGNGGDVMNLLSQAKVRMSARIRKSGSVRQALEEAIFLPADFDPDWDRETRADSSRAEMFKGFVGFERIVKQFESYQQMVAGMRLHSLDPKPYLPWTFIFKGPPGTGKTSTARKVGRLYYDMSLLSTEEVVTCSVTDLVGSYNGHTGPKVISVMEKGLGKVLFIDEAYRLAGNVSSGGSGQFHDEAIGELVDALTKPRYAGNMVVILAGYTAEMELLMRTNPGLRSRFPEHLTFPNMDPHSSLILLRQELRKLKIEISDPKDPGDESKKQVHRLFAKLGRTKGWANGRDIETLAKNMIRDVYMRQGRAGKLQPGGMVITTKDLIRYLQVMYRERLGAQDKDDGEQ